MARIIIQGFRGYDGDYELDTERAFNAREWRWIKKISGYLPLNVQEGFAGRDPDLFIALAVIALCRDRKIDREDGIQVADVMAEEPLQIRDNVGAPEKGMASITLLGDKVEDDALPPALTSELVA